MLKLKNRTSKAVLVLSIVLFFVNKPIIAEDTYYVSTSFHEPANEGLRFIYSKDGINWNPINGIWLKPTVGTQKVLRDPSIVRSPDGKFHMVWTSSWKGDLGFGYSSSYDLIKWTKPRMIKVMKKEPSTVNVWAPELFYDDTNNQFLIFWASCIPGRFAKGIEDDNNNHRLYYVTTKDFVNISNTKLLFDPGYSVIDATILKRAQSDYVMVFKDNTRPNRNLKVALAKSPSGPYTTNDSAFTEGYCEGPTVEKINETYYIFYDSYRKFIYGATKTNDFVNFTDATNEVSIPKGHKHGTIFKAPASIINNLLKNQPK